MLTETPTLIHYDPNFETVVCADSSSFGLGAVLKQKYGDKLLPVAYASSSLSSTEQRCAQIEKRLAATWACEKFQSYLIGLSFTVHTDHSPLVRFSEKKFLRTVAEVAKVSHAFNVVFFESGLCCWEKFGYR